MLREIFELKNIYTPVYYEVCHLGYLYKSLYWLIIL